MVGSMKSASVDLVPKDLSQAAEASGLYCFLCYIVFSTKKKKNRTMMIALDSPLIEPSDE